LTRGASALAVARAMASARRLSGMGTREFAAAVCETLGRPSLHPSTVSKWEHGVVTPPADVLLSAALVAKVPIELLFNETTAGPEPADRLRRLEDEMSDLSVTVARLAAAAEAVP
jgi:transcriptional regulator with XRE-family HTH domain